MFYGTRTYMTILIHFVSSCQININECDPNPCQNGGTCQDSENRYECVCSASFTGERCDINVSTALPAPCWACLLCPA